MQFAYQFPQLVERLILVGSGGVTKDVNVALRIASLPMGTEALSPAATCRWCCRHCRWSDGSAAHCSAPPASVATFPDMY